jgi:hypothetical protein
MGKKLNGLVCPTIRQYEWLIVGLVNVYAKGPETAWEAALIFSRQILTSGLSPSLLSNVDEQPPWHYEQRKKLLKELLPPLLRKD